MKANKDLINKPGTTGSTPLFTAVWYNRMDHAKFLLSSGADMNHHNFKGNTPLSMAVEKNHKAMLKMLFEEGAVFTKEQLKTIADRIHPKRIHPRIKKLVRTFELKRTSK